MARDPGFRLTHEIYQWLRAALPVRLKRWVKRAVLRRPHDGWTPITPAAPAAWDAQASPDGAKHDIVVLAILDWHGRFQRPQQLARQCAVHGHRVFYVGVTFDGAPAAPGVVDAPEVEPRLRVVRLHGPARLNAYQDRLDDGLAAAAATAFDRLREAHQITGAVTIVQLPFWRPLAERLRERFGWKIVYDCLDRHAAFTTNAPGMVQEEERLARASDLVVATSRSLLEALRPINSRCVLVPNGADAAHFGTAPAEGPAVLRLLPGPILGYCGAIAEWFDTDLVAEMARMRPQWSFVLIGATHTADLRPLDGVPNVHLLGEQPYASLPGYVHGFDVCLIPFRRTPLTEATNPVKLYEYLGAGKPVVATPLPEVQALASDGLVSIAGTAAEAVAAVDACLAHDAPARRDARRAYARRNTWMHRYATLAAAIRNVHPLVSVIVPVRDNLELTRLCLDSIRRNTSWPRYEIIVVDNASTDGTQDYLREQAGRHDHLRVLSNARNEGFARAVNRGITAAAGDYLVLLNNDTVVTRGWLTTLVRHLEAHPDVGMVGPATNMAGNEAKIEVPYARLDEMEAFASDYTHTRAGQAFEIPVLSFFCVSVPRRIIDAVGLLDERFGVGMFEDDDFSLRVRLAGYRLLCVEDAFVHHFHGGTFRQMGEREYLETFDANRRRFEAKWNTRWTPHRYRWQPQARSL